MIIIKSKSELAAMRESGRIVALTLEALREKIKPGVTTAELDKVAERILNKFDAKSPFKNYPNHDRHARPFPAYTCISVNEELVHGVPGKRPLKEGDIVTIDCGAIYKGWVGDGAWTFPVGKIGPKAQRLLEVTEGALYEAIAQSRTGRRTGDVSAALQKYVESRGYNVVRDYTSHGVGRHMHEDPQVPNFGDAGHGPKLRPGMTIAMEPMVMIGGPDTKVLADQWTVVPKDGQLTAHFEHTIAVTDGEAEILTRL